MLRATALLGGLLLPAMARGQWSTVYEQRYLPAAEHWTFRKDFPQADRLFNAFDYGHAIVY